MKRTSFPPTILRNMRTDIKSNEKEYIVKVDVPGYKKEDIQISVDDAVLKIVSDTETSSETETENVIAKERFEGHCERCIRLSEDADVENIKAEVSNGVLKITIPKKEVPQKNIKTINID